MPKVAVSASVEIETVRRLADEAKRRGVTLSMLINRVLAEYLHSQEPQAPARARSGRVKTVTAQEQVEL